MSSHKLKKTVLLLASRIVDFRKQSFFIVLLRYRFGLSVIIVACYLLQLSKTPKDEVLISLVFYMLVKLK